MKDIAKLRNTLNNIFKVQFDKDRTYYIHTDLVKDLKADELDIIEIVMELEDEFEINISDKEKDKWKTVGDMLKCVCEKLNVKETEVVNIWKPIDVIEPICDRWEILDL